MSDGIFSRENDVRTDAYRKDERLERALLELNRLLEPEEPEVPEDGVAVPHLFVVGLPRSGTTLTHQVLSWALDVAYVTNVMARFWLAPYAGTVVSRSVLGDARDGSFASDYGKSIDPAGSHEFAYFWHRWLGIDELEDLLNFSGDSAKADWSGLLAALRRIRTGFGKPLLFKTNYAAQFLPAFAMRLPMPLFVHVRRNPLEVALSILEARRRYYGDVSQWWATYPPEYSQLAERSVPEQIAGQVVGLQRVYAAQIAKTSPRLIVEFSYDDLCVDPRGVVELVRDRCRSLYGAAPELLHPLPECFERAAQREPVTAEEIALAEALERALARAGA